MNIENKYLIVAAAIATIISVVGFSYFVLLSLKSKFAVTDIDPHGITIPSPTPKSSLEDWQTYRNEEFGFEVKYP